MREKASRRRDAAKLPESFQIPFIDPNQGLNWEGPIVDEGDAAARQIVDHSAEATTGSGHWFNPVSKSASKANPERVQCAIREPAP